MKIMKNFISKAISLTLLLGTSTAFANVTPNVANCLELKSAMESNESVYLANDIDCSGISIWRSKPSDSYDRLASPIVDGNGHKVINSTFVTRSGILNGDGITRNITFDGVHIETPTNPLPSNSILAHSLGSKGYISNVKVKKITSSQTLTGLFDSMRGSIDGLKVKLGKNRIISPRGLFAHVADGTVNGLKIVNGDITLTQSFAGLFVNFTQGRGSYTDIHLKGMKVRGPSRSIALIGDYLGDSYFNGFVMEGIKLENPTADIAVVLRLETFSRNVRVLNVQHDFWAEWAEPLFPDILTPINSNTNIIETRAMASDSVTIPAQCDVYLKQDYYWWPQSS